MLVNGDGKLPMGCFGVIIKGKLTSLEQVFVDDHVRNNPYSVWERGYVRCINWRKLRSALKVSFSFIFIFIYRFSFSFRELQELHELH